MKRSFDDTAELPGHLTQRGVRRGRSMRARPPPAASYLIQFAGVYTREQDAARAEDLVTLWAMLHGKLSRPLVEDEMLNRQLCSYMWNPRLIEDLKDLRTAASLDDYVRRVCGATRARVTRINGQQHLSTAVVTTAALLPSSLPAAALRLEPPPIPPPLASPARSAQAAAAEAASHCLLQQGVMQTRDWMV